MQMNVGDRLPDIELHPSVTQLFRFSAVTWNSHRIHYDIEWARHEGHKGLLVPSHLHAANALRPLTDGLGPESPITNAAYRVVRPAAARETLIATAVLALLNEDGNPLHVALHTENRHRQSYSEGTAC